MNQCPLLTQVERYHDGELPAREQQSFADHLPQCSACQARLEELLALSRRFQEHAWPTLSAASKERLRTAVEQAALAQVRAQARLRLTAWGLLATAAAILLASLVGIWSAQQAPPQRPGAGEGPTAANGVGWELLAVSGEASERLGSDTMMPEMQLASWMAQDLGRPQHD